MKTFSRKDEFVTKLAKLLFGGGQKIEGCQLAGILTANNFYSNSGTAYQPDGRGKTVYLKGLSLRLKRCGRQTDAGAVENAFTKKDSKTLFWEEGK